MTKTWKVSWNSKLYNYKKLISDFKNNINSGIIYQSKGRAIMKNLPQINDIVHISCNKQHIMKVYRYPASPFKQGETQFLLKF